MEKSEPGEYDILSREIHNNIYALNNALDVLRMERNRARIEIERMEGLTKELESDFLPYPHIIIDDEYIEYHINVNRVIDRIIFHGDRYIIPPDKIKYNVYGTIIIKVKRNGYNSVVYTNAILNNYIHRCGTSLCTGNLKIANLSVEGVERLTNQLATANLDSPYNKKSPYRSLRTLANTLRKEGTNDRAWRV